MRYSLSSILVFALLSSCAFAIEMKGISPVNPLEVPSSTYSSEPKIRSYELKKATLSKNAVKNQYTIAMSKYTKSNVRSAYSDFRLIIDSVSPSDYVYMKMSKDMAAIGFFNLSELAMSKIQDDSLASLLEEDIKKYYFPASMLTQKDQIYLSELYSNMQYNDQSREATAELSKQTSMLSESDYANYIAAYGSMKSGNISQAKLYINNAISKNPKNLNYKRLKAEILSQSDNPKDALNILNDVENSDFKTVLFQDEINSSKEYVLYKSVKNDYQKKYHLAYYYYDNKEYNKAIGVLQTSISGKKSINKDVFALYAKVYYEMKEYEKAQNYALKTLDIDKSNVGALFILGNIAARNKDYPAAIKYYKKISGKNSDFAPELALAQVYLTLNDIQKAKEIYSKILKVSAKSFMAYYQMALLEPDRELEYLKKTISINPDFKDAWIDLAKVAIKKDHIDNAISYLSTVKFIDDSDFRYYYYLGLVLKNKGLITEAQENFEQSLKLNPNFELSKKELNI